MGIEAQAEALARTLPAVAVLARARKNETRFLASHQMEAALRIHRLFEKAQIRQNVTMRYGPKVSGLRGNGDSVSDMAIDARMRLESLLTDLPRDCQSVLRDICGYDMGIHDVEQLHGWPRRSGKIVLRLALDLAAARMGLSPLARGQETCGTRFWVQPGAMPSEIG
ncbi:DUF6456 domain-containing protein [Pelagibacterium lentulum]|uniref:DUF6456 domain-containing protein n=1 Tax=Pelagibacterium lentulum TaxID=2029865 RepID=A0A916VZE2_9HYPH|nr:DUF6456 domain-containing protein [Pelagibacterium lentulum]GGA54745.1 hypothetical protein GCM10011499_26140 [Pelagibacterium lentulum]